MSRATNFGVAHPSDFDVPQPTEIKRRLSDVEAPFYYLCPRKFQYTSWQIFIRTTLAGKER